MKMRLTAIVTVLWASLAVTGQAQREVSERGQQRLIREVRHELVMQPYYGVFDNLAYRVDGAKVTLFGQVSRPTLKSDAERSVKKIEGIEVMPVLTARAPRFVYVLGDVKNPGRYPLDAPTTVMQAIATAGSWNNGAHINNIVVFRRAEDWRLIATVLDLRAALLGRRPCPGNEIWVSDADLIIVPKSKILRTDNFIELLFTKGLYGIAPFSGSVSFTNLSTVAR